MAAKQKEQHRHLIKKYKIHFDGQVDKEKWPRNHDQTFANIQNLGRTEFAQYHANITIDSEEKPWRGQTRRRAERITALARVCREGRKNEAGWRLTMESEILARFTVEVACRKCRARLWRSELEVTSSSLDRFAESLETRQKNRVPCSCRPGSWREDFHEQGVNLLFDDRAEEHIVQDQSLQSEMPQKEKPDRVYGLRMTKRLERLLLWSEDKRVSSAGKSIGECIRFTPFRPDGEPIVFPFLALEAKSEKGRDGFSDVEMQTAFTIRALLKLQGDLRNATGEDSEWESGPLVWFLSYKGEQWRVAAAYIEYENGVEHYRVIDLWDGRITSNEGSLRLLLIVDYIFDWARDIYREAIIRQLRALSASDDPSLANDSDIFSMVDRVNFWPLDTQTTRDSASHEPEIEGSIDVQDPWRAFDSPHGAARDAKYIQSRFMALYITEDNLSVLMNSMKTPQKSQQAARTVLRCFKDSWRVSMSALDAIEHMWTGRDRENSALYNPNKIFFVMVTLTAYLSPCWEQTRELSYLAVSADVIKDLLEHAKLQNTFFDIPYVENDVFVGIFQAFRSIGVRDNLLATISRACISTKVFAQKAKKDPDPRVMWAKSEEKVKNGVKYRFDAALMPDRHAYAREFVSSTYNLHKIGRNEPSSSIFRISSRFEEQEPNSQAIETLWPVTNLLDVDQQSLLCVVSKNPSNISRYAELCVFVMDQLGKSDILQPDENLDVPLFQAQRLDSNPGWGRGWNNTEVKAQDADLPRMVSEFLNHLKKFSESSTQNKDERDSQRDSARSLELRNNKGNWDLATITPWDFLSTLKFRDLLSSRGSRVTSITNLFRQPPEDQTTETEAAPSESNSRLSLPQASRNISDSDTRHTTNETLATQAELDCSAMARGVGDEEPGMRTPVAENSDSTSRGESSRSPQIIMFMGGPTDDEDPQSLDPQSTGRFQSASTSTKRAVGHSSSDTEEEVIVPSSSGVSPKRRRTDSAYEFTSDYLDEEELDILLARGHFA